jgi:hypothetical protein
VVAEFSRFSGGNFVVFLWWDAGRNVVAEGHFSAVEQYANFLKFIFAPPEV